MKTQMLPNHKSLQITNVERKKSWQSQNSPQRECYQKTRMLKKHNLPKTKCCQNGYQNENVAIK